MRHPLLLLFAVVVAAAAQTYNGPRPEQPDLPYLKHADNLAPTDASEAKEQKKKDTTTYVIEGASAKAQTPLASPIFIMQADKLAPEKLQLYRFDVKNGHREVFFSKKGKGSARPRRINVSPLGGGLYKIETGESLENGEYGLSPDGSNQVFCFQVY